MTWLCRSMPGHPVQLTNFSSYLTYLGTPPRRSYAIVLSVCLFVCLSVSRPDNSRTRLRMSTKHGSHGNGDPFLVLIRIRICITVLLHSTLRYVIFSLGRIARIGGVRALWAHLFVVLYDSFYRESAYWRAILISQICPSVCLSARPSVCPSVTFRHQMKTA